MNRLILIQGGGRALVALEYRELRCPFCSGSHHPAVCNKEGNPNRSAAEIRQDEMDIESGKCDEEYREGKWR